MKRISVIMMIICLQGIPLTLLLAQIKPRSEDQTVDRKAIESMLDKGQTKVPTGSIPMEGAIDAEKYTLGPSDVVAVGLWGPVSFSYTLAVTPEGTLILPSIGEIRVSGMKLSEAKKTVVQLVRKQYHMGDVTFTLLTPRAFIVSLRGAVSSPGQYVASSVDRVEKIFKEGTKILYPAATMAVSPSANEEIRLPSLGRENEHFKSASTRNIMLIRKNGDTLHVDIPKFYGTGEDRFNPYLLDGDIIVVKKRNLEYDFVSIQGAVNVPGSYEFVNGDRLLDLINVAQGLTTMVDSTQIILSRLDEAGLDVSEEVFDLRSVKAGLSENKVLMRGDRILIKGKASQKRDFQVYVSGEIKNPGYYPVTQGRTRLSRLIQNAGGFTDHALLSGAMLLRKEQELNEIVDAQFHYARSIRANPLLPGDSTYYFLEQRSGYQPVVVNFSKLFSEKDTTFEVIVRGDDIVFVPSNLHTVIVNGQVVTPGHIPYVPGMNYQYYIKQAGGFLESAIPGDVRVIKKATLAWVDPSETNIESGDQIWVPKKLSRDFSYYFGIGRDAVSVVAAIATAVLLYIQVSK